MIAITGANGLLGSHLLRRLVDEGTPVVALRRRNSDLSQVSDLQGVRWREVDILNPISIQEAFLGATTVIHTAAFVSFNPRLLKKIMEVNVEGTHNVVNACLSMRIPRLIHISSVAALGRKKGMVEIDESSRWIESDLNTDYAKSKYLSELEVWRAAEEGLSVSVINPSVILAPTNWTKSSAQLFQYVWQEKQFYSDTKINYVDVRDVVEIVWQVFSRNISGEKFIANAGSVPIKILFDKIASRFKKRSPSIRINPSLLSMIALFEEFRSLLIGTEPLISRQSAKVTKESFYFQNHKTTHQLEVSFKNLEETLDWCCDNYLQTYTTNK